MNSASVQYLSNILRLSSRPFIELLGVGWGEEGGAKEGKIVTRVIFLWWGGVGGGGGGKRAIARGGGGGALGGLNY